MEYYEKNKKEENSWTLWIEYILFTQSLGMAFSAIMWTFTQPTDHWLWFSRAIVSMMCFGFYGIVRSIRKNKEV